MKSKLIQSIPAVLVLLVIVFRYFSQWCIIVNKSCYGTWVHWIYISTSNPLYLFSLYAIPIAIVLVFVPRNLFNLWLRFSLYAIPIAFIFTATTPVNFTGIGIDFLPFYRDDAARLASEIFSIASLAFLILSYLRNRLYDFDIKKYNTSYAVSDKEDLTIAFISTIGFISAVVVSVALLLNVSYKILSMEALLSIFGVSIFTSAYVIYYATISIYKKLTNHLKFGWKLSLGLWLLVASIAVYAATFILVITHIQ